MTRAQKAIVKAAYLPDILLHPNISRSKRWIQRNYSKVYLQPDITGKKEILVPRGMRTWLEEKSRDTLLPITDIIRQCIQAAMQEDPYVQAIQKEK